MKHAATALAATMGLVAAGAIDAATVTLVPGAGFSDTTPATPEGGNSGVTLGEQRTILFNAAGAAWGRALTSSQVIRISAAFTSEFCNSNSAVLGAAGATAYGERLFSGQSRWVPVALLEALAGTNANGTNADIDAVFNATLDSGSGTCLGGTRWYYGLVGPAPAGTIALYPTVMHEIGHGLGFASFLCEDSDGCGGTAYGGYFNARPDRWSDFVRDNGAGKLWSAMTNAERITSFTRDPQLVWNGASVNGRLAAFGQDGGELNGGFMRLYAPPDYEPGSSVSHFHEDANPNLLMEPSADSDVFLQTDLTDCLLADMGWTNTRCNDTAPSFNALSNVTINEDATQAVALSGLAANGAGQSLSITAVSGDERLLPDPAVTYSNPQSTGSVLLAPLANASGSAVVVVYANDSAGSSTPRSFTLTVTPQNDAPVLDASKSPALPAVLEDSGAPSGAVGARVSALVDYASPSGQVDNVTDVDTSPAPLLGIALVAADGANGTWRYSTNNGSSWIALGSVGESTARLLAADANARLHFTPNANFSGTATVTFRAWDRTTGTAGGTANISASGGITAFSSTTDTITATVTNNNDPPTSSAPAAVNGTEDVASTFTAGNALSVADTDGGTLTVTLTANRGALTLPAAGLSFTTGDGTADATMTFSGAIGALNTALASLSHAPTADYNGSASVAFSVSDGAAAPVVKNIALSLSAVADIANDSVATSEDTTLVFNAITGTAGASADSFENPGRAVTSVTPGANGTANFLADGTLTYTPGTNFNGNDAFTYTVTSGGATETATVSVAVSAVNDPPAASNLSTAETYVEDTTRALFDIVASDVDSTTVTATLTLSNPGAGVLTTPTSGLVASSFNGIGGVWSAAGPTANVNAVLAAVEFVPAPHFSGNFTIATSVSDGLLSATGSKAMTGTAVNDPPAATHLSAAESYTEDTTLPLTDIVASDVDSGTLTATLALSMPAAGALTTTTSGGVTSAYNAGTGTWSASGPVAGVNAVLADVAFVPAANFNASFAISTSVGDGALAVTGSKAITGTPVNDAPTSVVNPIILGSEDGVVSFTAGSAISVADVDGGALRVSLGAGSGAFTLGSIAGLSFTTGDGTADAAMVFDGTQAALNTALATLTYVPLADFNGSVALTTAVEDLVAPAVSKGTALLLDPVADLVNDSVTTARDTPSTFNVVTGVGGASADNFENPGRVVSAVGTPSNGEVAFAANGSVTYTPDPGFEGNDSFSYTVNSGGVDETGSVGIAVVPPSAPPQATNLSVPEVYTEDTALDLVDIVVTDDSATVTATLAILPTSAGTLSTGNAGGVTSVYDADTGTWSASGSVAQINAQLAAVQFIPAPDANANAMLAVKIADEGQSVSGTKVLTGTALNDAPTSSAPAGVATVEDLAFAFTATNALHAGDVDNAAIAVALAVDSGALTLGVTTGLSFSTGDGNSDEAITFTASPANAEAALASLVHVPAPDYNGAATLAFSVSDGIAAPVARNIALAAAAVADAADDSVGTFENTAVGFNVLTGANGASADAFEGPATVIAVTQGVIGSVVFAADGSVTYTPAANQSGNDGFTYTVLAGGVTETANVSVAVGDVNAAPAFDAIANPAPIAANAAQQIVNVTGISAGPGESQALVLTASSDNPALIPNPTVTYASPQSTGTLAYTPVAGAFGTATLTVTLQDNGGTAGGGVDSFSRKFIVTVVPGTPLIFRNGFEGN